MKLARLLSLTVAALPAWMNISAAQSACPSCSTCNVPPIVKTGSVGPLAPSSNYPSVPVEKFDSSLGVLTGMRIQVSIDVVGRIYRFENLTPAPCGGSQMNPDYF